MEDCDNHLQQPWEEAKPKKKTTETLPDDFSTLCRVTITTDGGGGGGVEAVMQEIEGEAQEKQQQHGEGKQLKKKMMKKKNDKKKKKKNKRGPLRASNTRSFTPEEKEAYHKQVEETEVCISIPWVNVYVHVLCLSTSFSLPIFESLIVVYMCARSYIFNLNGMTFCMPRGLAFWTSPLM